MNHFVYFISPHGYGHASRAAAIITEVTRLLPESRFTLFTTVPTWFFEDSVQGAVRVEAVDVDLGMVQRDALTEDLAATVRELRERIPFAQAKIDTICRRVEAIRGDVLICDIAPLGLVVARHLGLPSVLVENFTWDWIYRGYEQECPGLSAPAAYLEEAFTSAGHIIQTEPVCVPASRATTVAPVSRAPRTDRADVRRRLGVPDEASLVTITMGGIGWQHDRLAVDSTGRDDLWLVVPGDHPLKLGGPVIRLPHRSDFFHPDLIHASDAVVGKLGYSTLAEVWSAGLPFAYLTRQRFPESAALETWLQGELPCQRVDVTDFDSGAWLDKVTMLLEAGRRHSRRRGGATAAAKLLIETARSAR